MSKILEVLTKSANGQWSLFKAWVKDEKESTPAKKFSSMYPTASEGLYPTAASYRNPNKVLQTKNKIALDDMMDLVGKGGASDSDFHDFIRKAPKGSIDFGHIFDKVKGNPDLKHLVKGDKFVDNLNHHLDGVRDLKDIHDHHGGLDAVEGIVKHFHGANGVPSQYSRLSLGKHNRKLHAEMMDISNPGRGSTEYDINTPDPMDRPDYYKHIDPALNKETIDSYHEAIGVWDNDDADDDDAHELWKKHGRAAIKRGMDAFKKFHRI